MSEEEPSKLRRGKRERRQSARAREAEKWREVTSLGDDDGWTGRRSSRKKRAGSHGSGGGSGGSGPSNPAARRKMLKSRMAEVAHEIRQLQLELVLEDIASAGGGGEEEEKSSAAAAAGDSSAAPAAAPADAAAAAPSSAAAAAAAAAEAVSAASPARGGDSADDGADDEAAAVKEWQPPPHCVPICADVRSFDWHALAVAQRELTGRLFDVVMMDPPWQLASSNPTRGVAIGYSALCDADIRALPMGSLQTDGFLAMWVINAKMRFALRCLRAWGYVLVDEVVWVKQTVNRRLAKSHGYYLQHAKETCLIARKGADPPGLAAAVGSDVLYSERRGQSQKPEAMYELLEKLVPGGTFLEIFGRRNNLRDYWVTVGNEL